MKYKVPYKLRGTNYPWAYKIVEPKNFSMVRNFVRNSQNRFIYADYVETTDAKILSHKQSNMKNLEQNYICVSDNILPSIKKSEPTILFNNEEGLENSPTFKSLGSFLYGNGGNPHVKALQQQQQPEKRYSFTMKVMSHKDGSLSTFTVNNATEEEAKQQMRQRFPNWTEAMIDTKFKMYTEKQSMVGENVDKSRLVNIVENMCRELIQRLK